MKRNGQWSGPVVSHQGFMIFPQSVASQLTKGNKSMMSPRSEASGWLRILKAAQKPGLKGLKPQGVRHQSELKGCVSGFSYLLLLLFFFNPVAFVMPYVWIPEREDRRPPRQCNSQKGRFTADLSQGSCHTQRSGAGSETPEPELLYKFIGWA